MIGKRKSVKQQIKEKATVLRSAQRRLAQVQVLPSALASSGSRAHHPAVLFTGTPAVSHY
jgi:hypothetical protein